MGKDIVIIANFCGALNGNDNDRFVYLAERLARDHSVELVTSDFDHSGKQFREKLGDFPFHVKLLHEIGYPKNICLRRFASHHAWGRSVAAYLKTRKKPDVVYCAVPSLSAPKAAADWCAANGVPFLVDVQDLWPEAFRMAVDIPVVSGIAFAPFQWMANRIYKQADGIAAVSESYCQRAMRVNRKCKEAHPVFLGTELAGFDANAAANPVTDKPEGELWLGYCGTLAASYDLTLVMDALKRLKERDVTPLKFVVMGDGARKEEFEAYAARLGVDAVFTGRLPYGEMCGLLAACDMVVNPITGKSAASIINKHGDYAASGLPVINTQESPEYRALVETYRMGFNCPNGDAAAVADALERLVKDPELRRELGRNARRCAEERFDRAQTYQKLTELIERQASR